MRTFVISLPEFPDRLTKANQHFQEIGLSNCPAVGPVTVFDGIYASGFGLITEHPYNRDRTPAQGDFFMGPHPTGIFLSHYMLWAACNLLPDEHFFIMEIDAKFEDNWRERLEAALSDVPKDFDMLYIGSCGTGGKRHSTHIVNSIYISKNPVCLHAYVVAKKALPIILKTQRDCYGPIDITLTLHSHPHLKVYTVLPRIAEQFNTVIGH